MNFAISLFFAVLIASAICVKNDKKKNTVDNDNSDGEDERSNSVGTMTKALRVLSSILVVQSGFGLANASPQPTKSDHSKELKNQEVSATPFLRNGLPNGQFGRGNTPPAAEVGNQPLNTKTPAVQNEMPTSPSSPDRSGEDPFLNEDYATRKHHRPINNKKF